MKYDLNYGCLVAQGITVIRCRPGAVMGASALMDGASAVMEGASALMEGVMAAKGSIISGTAGCCSAGSSWGPCCSLRPNVAV